MKKIILPINLCLALITHGLCSSLSYGYVSGKVPVIEETISCPSSLTCSGNQCKTLMNNNTFWDYYSKNEIPNHSLSNCPLAGVNTSYHPSKYTKTTCFYYRQSPQNGCQVTLASRDGANLEAYISKPSQWNIDGVKANCSPKTGGDACPLKLATALGIYNENIPNGVIIGQLQPRVEVKKYELLSYDTVLAKCGSAKQCTLDVASSGAVFGSVTVDMDNKMKIVRIEMSKPSYVNIQQMGEFNTVKVSYLNDSVTISEPL